MKIPIGGWTCAIMTANKSRNISGIKARANRKRRIFFSDPPTKLVHSDKIAQSSFAISHFGPTKITKEENPSGRNYFSFREFNFHVTYKVSVNSCAPLLISIGRASNITVFFFLFYFSSLLISLFSIFVDENEEEIFTTGLSGNFGIAFIFSTILFLPFNILDWQISKLNVNHISNVNKVYVDKIFRIIKNYK